MKAVGLVVEYNPFHNGHRLHIQESKQQTGADVVIAVMSGSFLQRGEPALVSKWARTEMALQGGVDLVIELPYRFATANAEFLLRGSISLLEALRCHSFCFGSEDGRNCSFFTYLSFTRRTKRGIQSIVQTIFYKKEIVTQQLLLSLFKPFHQLKMY